MSARPMRPGSALTNQLKSYGFKHQIAPSEKKYYVNKQGYQISIEFVKRGSVKEVRLLDCKGYVLWRGPELLPDLLESWSKLERPA
jgi:hypothetical protein